MTALARQVEKLQAVSQGIVLTFPRQRFPRTDEYGIPVTMFGSLHRGLASDWGVICLDACLSL